MINTTEYHFKKGEYVKVKAGFNQGVIGMVLRCGKGLHSDLIFTSILTTNNKTIHGLNEAFVLANPTIKQIQKIKLSNKLRCLN